MVCEDTLRIKNFPKEITDTEKEDFLRHFGAIKVKIITSKAKQKSVAFAKFDSKETAKVVLLRLHQLTVLNCRLCVEYAENDIGTAAQTKAGGVVNATGDGGEYFQQFLKRLNSWNIYSFHQPPPSHLKYSYPSPNRATISNIAHALASVPKFYTQVLHLMNKMNLPPPFSNIPDHVFAQQMLKTSLANSKEYSTDESEIESDDDGTANKLKDVIPAKRRLSQKKVVKRPKFIKPIPPILSNNKESENVDNVFDRVNLQMQPKIQLNINPERNVETQQSTSTNNIENVIATEIVHKTTERVHVITVEELQKDKKSLEELKTLPVFKDYNPGVPTAKLYIKNIAKAVELKDLEYIYERYHTKIEGVEDQFSIKLMKEGRMKGQAFINFNTVESAQQALEETNGYVLKEKALVVMFAKSAAQQRS